MGFVLFFKGFWDLGGFVWGSGGCGVSWVGVLV